MEDTEQPKLRQKKITVLAFGEGENEKIFLRQLDDFYCRSNKIAVSTSSAGGGDPTYILNRAIRFRRGVKRDIEFILLDTDIPWPEEMTARATKEEIELIGNTPSLESLFLEILKHPPEEWKEKSTRKCKELFETHCTGGRFNEEECARLFTKAVLNEARNRIPILDKIIKIMEGELGVGDGGEVLTDKTKPSK